MPIPDEPNPITVCCGFRGQSAGITRIKGDLLRNCKPGEEIMLRHGEIMQHEGLPDLAGHVDPKRVYLKFAHCQGY